MPEASREIRGLESPDHWLGLLGRLAHAVTADYLGNPPASPAFHIGYNTLPDPPYPMPSRIRHDLDTLDGWLACGQDVHLFLEAGLRSLRAHPVADPASFDDQTRLVHYLLRTDAMALAWRARVVHPTQSVAAWTLAADLLAGRAGPGDLTPDASEAVIVTVAVDRAGATLLAYASSTGTQDDILVAGTSGSAMDDVAVPLRDLLDAQHAWAIATFGTQPPPGKSALAQALRNLREAAALAPEQAAAEGPGAALAQALRRLGCA
jgi:hypothetical protein